MNNTNALSRLLEIHMKNHKIKMSKTMDDIMVWIIVLLASVAVLSGLKVWQASNRAK